ncbi:MAG: excinuclease ABC subunit UvrC [Planctomycetota bacterium]|nr:excinuclease ABC subunit UvrC [Planctomycetota bacterium]MCX8039846.1 excinuclease ABC subunit UvrC [Planctomycetota bacterium]MDW8372823.1 excinuclease ABC subunit UvrC [Planctomycetota bacterium]
MPPLSEALRAKIAGVPDQPGCYLWKNADGRVLYVGKAKQLRRRVASYAQRLADLPVRLQCMLGEAADLEWLVTGSEVEALLTEALLIKELQPKYNIALKDGKTYPLLAITREPFPRVFVTRERQLPNAELLGPFPSATDLQRAVHFLQRVFRFRACDLEIREDDPARRSFSPCLNWHIKRCSAPCTTRISAAEYQADIRALRAFVAGRGRSELLADLTARMKDAAKELRFEDAARIRDQIQALARLSERGRLADYREPAAPVLDAAAGLAALQRHLALPAPPRVIEGFDIAHLQGRFVVAGLVQFVGGVPHKDGYRRFRVQGALPAPRNDDCAAMREVVARRYRRLCDEGRALPDLVLIDGGAGQLRAAQAALAEVGVALPALIALAKREETVVRADGSPLALPRRDPGLRLLQYVRDEAHRFCRRYFHLLQRQALEESAADPP